MADIGFQDALDSARRSVGRDIAIELAPERRIRTEAAADMNVIALDRIGIFRHAHLAGDQANIADIVLSTGMMTAGEMYVHRHVERDARLAPARDVLGMLFRIGSRKPAAAIAGAGDEPRAD